MADERRRESTIRSLPHAPLARPAQGVFNQRVTGGAQRARAGFGVRGLRLYTDGIPATMPDGQGQASTIALGSAQRIEVLRGPLAQLYGNAAGGVVQELQQL